MPKVDVLCLASSWKSGGRCVAGVRLDNGAWIRPVSETEDGQKGVLGCQFAPAQPSGSELAAESAEKGVLGCQFGLVDPSGFELAAESAEKGVLGCQFGQAHPGWERKVDTVPAATGGCLTFGIQSRPRP